MTVIYQSTISRVGESARDGFEDNMLVTFAESKVTEDMADYCFVHAHNDLQKDFCVGDTFSFNGKHYTITAIGEQALENFRVLGHATFYFDGETTPLLPGAIHLLGTLPKNILEIGCHFSIESS